MTIFEEIEDKLKGRKSCSFSHIYGNALIISYFNLKPGDKEKHQSAYEMLKVWGGENFVISIKITTKGFYGVSIIEKNTGDRISLGTMQRAFNPHLENAISQKPFGFPLELRISGLGGTQLMGLIISGAQILNKTELPSCP
jgi:hypothetical protein